MIYLVTKHTYKSTGFFGELTKTPCFMTNDVTIPEDISGSGSINKVHDLVDELHSTSTYAKKNAEY